MRPDEGCGGVVGVGHGWGGSGRAGECWGDRDDGKPASVWPAYDRPVYRQGIEAIRIR